MARPFHPGEIPDAVEDFEAVKIYPDGRTVQYNDHRAEVPPALWRLLRLLVKSGSNRAYTRDEILDQCWGREANYRGADGYNDRTVDSAVKQLRAKLGAPKIIETIRGVGYKLGSIEATSTRPADLRRLAPPYDPVRDIGLPVEQVLPPDGPISGPRDLGKIAVSLISRAAIRRLGPVLMTFTGRDDLYDQFADLRASLDQAILAALEAGLKVHHLWSIDRHDKSRLIEFVREILRRLSRRYPGEYIPSIFRRDGYSVPPHDLLITPEAALLMLGTSQPHAVDRAILTTNQDVISVYREYFGQLRGQTRKLVEMISRRSSTGPMYSTWQSDWEGYINKLENVPGDRFLFKRGLSALTRPEPEYRPGSSWWCHYEDKLDVQRLSNLRIQRLTAFQKQIATYHFEDICPISALDEFVSRFTLPKDEEESTVGSEAPGEDILARLRHVRVMLDHPHYRLLLAAPSEEVGLPPINWVVKGDTVLLETVEQSYRDDHEEVYSGFVLTEPTIADSFRQLHRDTAKLIEAYRTPDDTRKILDRHIAWLEGQNPFDDAG